MRSKEGRLLLELALKMPTEDSYQLIMAYISRGGSANPDKLRKLSLSMPTEESYQLTNKSAERLAA